MDDSAEENIDMDLSVSFMFGNIGENGQLDEEFLDSNIKQQLGSLFHFDGFRSLVEEITSCDAKIDFESKDDKENKPVPNGHCSPLDKGKEDVFEKSPNAVDYGDINELADDYIETTTCDGIKQSVLMPAPVKDSFAKRIIEDPGKSLVQKRDDEPHKPLAAILPRKYQNVSVTELFPEFRVNKVLRFSRLFGSANVNSLPKLWRGCKKKRKKKLDENDSISEKPEENEHKRNHNLDVSPNQYCSDDDEKLLSVHVDGKKEEQISSESKEKNDMGPKATDWRFGPAQLWYDMLQLPENVQDFDYGFKLAEKTGKELEKKTVDKDIPNEAFLMVSQLRWEDDVIWNGEEIKQKVMQKLSSKNNAAGWVPTSDFRTAQAFSLPGKGPISNGANVRVATANIMPQQKNKMDPSKSSNQNRDEGDDIWNSIFPVENEELVYGLWENEIIWDVEKMNNIPKPKILTLDPNDENIILGIPEDIDPKTVHKDNRPQAKVKIPHPHVKKSKLLLGKAGVINVVEEDEAPTPAQKKPECNPFNISNDMYYMARSTETTMRLKVPGGNIIQHSIPVLELRPPYVPTHIGVMRLRNFHRPPMKRYSHGCLAYPGPHSVLSLQKHIHKKAKLREQERAAAGGGDIFFMRSAEDLTGRDGDIILVEFSEEHPPLINQVGMCTKVKNYFKRKAEKDSGPLPYKYGEIAYAHTSPFLGTLSPGQSIQVVENNMYRAPIYEHQVPQTDFLIIRTRNQYFIREVDALFVAGQQCPLYEVPGPNSKKANNFVRDFLQVFIYRLFWKSLDIPRRIRMDDVKKAFPLHSESSIRKRLKLCADFKRTGMDSNWWVIRPDFRLPNEEEIRAMVSPEQCCAFFSMIAAEQRLKDAGYGEKFLFTMLDDDDDEIQLKMDDEIKVAPWNTTRAYIQAVKGKCLLQLTGPADPTGCGEGFSYVRVPNKPTINKEEQEAQQPKRIVTGTDADLRRLSLNNAKALLRQCGVPEEEIKKLSRWEVIDVVRTLSTEKAKAGEQGMDKFSRGNRFSVAEHQERYKEESQRIFELQNRVLASTEALSTDENESTDEDNSDIEEMGKNIENMLENKKTSEQLTREKEEQQRQELRKMLMSEPQPEEKKVKDKKKDDDEGTDVTRGRVLKIHRTFKNSEGQEYTRVEIVRKPAVIEAYLSIRNTKDDSFIRQFAMLDEAQKEEMKREKRRIQEQLRRIKRIQERERVTGIRRPNSGLDRTMNDGSSSSLPNSLCNNPFSSNLSPCTSPSKRKKTKIKPDLKLKCGACGQVGHMRTNKACPEYQYGGGSNYSSGMLEDQEDETERQIDPEDQHLVNVEGTKVTLSSKLIRHAEEMKRRLLLKLPKESLSASSARKRKRLPSDGSCDYLKRHQRPVNRRRTDPVVVMSSLLEGILNEMRKLPDTNMFFYPVNAKLVPDYYKIISHPMDLQTMRSNLRQNKYQSREEFLADVNQMVQNSTLYNGAMSKLTFVAQNMLDTCVQCLREQEDRLMRLEKAINPLLDDNDQVALTYILDNIVSHTLKSLKESWPFAKPVDKKLIKDYYTIIKKPMDLETISKKVSLHKYHSRQEFLGDVQLILDNCITYNGKESPFTQKAEVLVKVAVDTVKEYDAHLQQLESSISKVQRRAMEQADIDTSWMPAEEENYTIAEPDFSETRTSSPDQVFEKETMEEFDFVDVVGDIEPELGKPTISEKKDLLEEDLQFSSDDEFDAVPMGIGPVHTEMTPLEVESMNITDNISNNENTHAVELTELGNVEYYVQQEEMIQGGNIEENIEIEQRYESDILVTRDLILPETEEYTESCIQDDLAMSDSDEELNVTSNVQFDMPQDNDVKHSIKSEITSQVNDEIKESADNGWWL